MVMINGAKIETRDVISSNGVTHVVDTVLMPPEGVMVGGALMVRSMNIVENAMNANNVTTLVAAVKAAGLVQTLSGPGPFTVFAPTNDAFSALPAGTVDTLLKPENKAQLTGILTYHVVPGALRAADLKEGQMLTTVNGATLKVTKRDGNTYVNGVMVQTADVISSNGVTHVVPSVLMPPTK
ncbi:fasciclin domain-containing protein [Patescibacteria group bacterium]|nr:fasciclin domain-containing protein [Patescibacteria group bacterium]MBP9709420.1 fasciclin domain-containing protein [Patescibacteria group bacterium]